MAKAVVDDWRSGARVLEHGMPRVHEQIATWGVPLRWFVFVDLAERELVAGAGAADAALPHRDLQGPPPGAPGACRCCARRSATAPITEAVEEGARWLEEFHPRSIVELDYGGLVGLLSDEDFREQTTRLGWSRRASPRCPEVRPDAAAEAYEQLVARWRERCNCLEQV